MRAVDVTSGGAERGMLLRVTVNENRGGEFGCTVGFRVLQQGGILNDI